MVLPPSTDEPGCPLLLALLIKMCARFNTSCAQFIYFVLRGTLGAPYESEALWGLLRVFKLWMHLRRGHHDSTFSSLTVELWTSHFPTAFVVFIAVVPWLSGSLWGQGDLPLLGDEWHRDQHPPPWFVSIFTSFFQTLDLLHGAKLGLGWSLRVDLALHCDFLLCTVDVTSPTWSLYEAFLLEPSVSSRLSGLE